MKTTIEVPDDLFRRAKAAAALQGLSMKEWLTNLLRREAGAGMAAPPKDQNSEQEAEAFVQELRRLASDVSAHWQGPQDAVAAIREQRRDLGGSRWGKQPDKHGSFEQCGEFFYRKPGLFDNGAQCSFCDFLMIRHHQSAVGLHHLSQDDVAAFLAIFFITQLGQSRYNFAPRHSGKKAHAAISMTSSLIGGGTGSPWACRLSR